MNGWFGDISPEFQEEQVNNIMNLSTEERNKWIERNKFNLTHYCGQEGEKLFNNL